MRPGTPGFLGERLREAREARGLSATSLADLIGVSRQAVSQYEHGKVTPHPEILRAISRALNLPVHFFCRDSSDRPPIRVIYRSLNSASRLAELRAERRFGWLIDIVIYLEHFVEFPAVNLPEIHVPDNPYAITDDIIEAAAEQVRSHWRLGSGPVSNVVRVLERNGVIVSRSELAVEGLDALSQWASGRPIVLLGADKKVAVRSRLDAAHELGHLILHRRVDLDYFYRPADKKLMELQAFKFAGAFLLPRVSFAHEAYRPTVDRLLALKARWRVSIAAMIKRLEALGLVTDRQASNLWITLSRRGWRKLEPLDDELQVEEPSTLRLAFELIVNEGVQTRDQILEHLPFSPKDIEELAGLAPGYLSREDTTILGLVRDRETNREGGKIVPMSGRKQTRN